MVKNYVLDTSAVLAFIHNEQGSDIVQKIFDDARKLKSHIYISFMTFTEVYYMIWKYKGEDAAKDVMALMNALPWEIVHSNDQLSLSAGRIKANHQLSVADAFIAATAMEKKAILVHKDLELEPMVQYVQVIHLPYKLIFTKK